VRSRRKPTKKNKFIITPFENKNHVIHAYHLYTILVDFNKLGKSRNQVMNELKKFNIGSQVLYIPVHFQPYYSNKYGYKYNSFPNSEYYYKKCLSIPIFPGIKSKEINYVINKVNSIIS
jgi:dTDP-4-amino-4,6-dideoxygalactose transaminase